MEGQLLSLFERAKKASDKVAASPSLVREVHRCLDALNDLKMLPITSRVLLSTPVPKLLQCLKNHPERRIRNDVSNVLDTWRRKLYSRNSYLGGKTKQRNSCGVSRTGTLIVKVHGRVIGRFPLDMSVKMAKTDQEKKIKEEKEKRFGSLKKSSQGPVMPIKTRAIKNVKIDEGQKRKEENPDGFGYFRKTSPKPAKNIKNQGNVRSFRRCFKKPSQASAKRIIKQEKETGFGTSFKKPAEEPIKCNGALRAKVRSLLMESLSIVAEEVGADLREAVTSRDPTRVAAEVESVMFYKMGPFHGTNKLKYRAILFNMRDTKNPDLRRKVLLGQVKPERLVAMTSEEMASKKRQFENEQIRLKSLRKKTRYIEQECKSEETMVY